MSFTWISDDVVLLVDHCDVLEDGDLDAFLQAVAARKVGPSGVRILTYNIVGGGPNAAQRARFGRQLRGKPLRIAVICTSSFTRVIIKAFHLLGFLQVASFAPDEEAGAFRYLGLAPLEVARVRDELAKLRDSSRWRSVVGV